MTDKLQRAQELIEHPSESLNVEIKRWINPEQSEGQAKIIQAVLALRNQNGGHLIIGFDNDTLKPDKKHVPSNVLTLFHPDKIQSMISKFASEPFEVEVNFPELDGQAYPVLTVSPGVRSPVAAKSDLLIEGKSKISVNDVYVRTLNSNNTVSTAKIPWKDWPRIIEICLENREADIGRFLRRHLVNLNPGVIQNIARELFPVPSQEVTNQQIIKQLMQESFERFMHVAAKRKVKLPPHGAREVALQIIGQTSSHIQGQSFLNLLASANPKYTGWPIWLVSDTFSDPMRPYTYKDFWEEFIFDENSIATKMFQRNTLEFIRFSPEGNFYQRSAYLEDMGIGNHASSAMKVIDFLRPAINVAEAIAVGIHFAKALQYASEDTFLAYMFRWTNLEGRKLVSVTPERMFWPRGPAQQDEVVTYIEVPMDTPLSAISDFVEKAVQPLYHAFEGYALGKAAIEEVTRKLLERKV